MFKITINELYWINKTQDNDKDICLHGTLTVKIGHEIIHSECTVSGAAFYLLQSIFDDHVFEDKIPILPCCAFPMFVSEETNHVVIMGCPNGDDFSIIHHSESVIIKTASNYKIEVDLEDYKKEVYKFADKIESFYEQCSPKDISEDYEKEAYERFWQEWKMLRYDN